MMVPCQNNEELLQFFYDVKIDSGIEFTYFKDIPEKDPYFAFSNDCSEFKVDVFQKGCEDQLVQNIPKGEEIRYGWIAPDGNKTMIFKFTAPGYVDHQIDVQLTKINTNTRVKLSSTDGKNTKYINIAILLRKTTKLVKIRDIFDLEGEKKAEKLLEENKNKNELIFELSIGGLGISLISPYEGTSIEPLYIYFGGIKMTYSLTDLVTLIHFKIKYLNFDNNATPLSPFPVILTPSFKTKSATSDFNLITFKMIQKNESKPEIQLFEELIFEVQSITIGLDDLTLNVILA